jgi:hypothetical protein
MLSYVEDEESGGGQQSSGGVLLEEPSEGYATAAGDSSKAE